MFRWLKLTQASKILPQDRRKKGKKYRSRKLKNLTSSREAIVKNWA